MCREVVGLLQRGMSLPVSNVVLVPIALFAWVVNMAIESTMRFVDPFTEWNGKDSVEKMLLIEEGMLEA